MSKVIKVEVVSDIACPWCLIGKTWLQKAATALGAKVEFTYKPFQLDANAPEHGVDTWEYLDQYFRRNYGASAAQFIAPGNPVEQAGAPLGYKMQYKKGSMTCNTLRGHMLIAAAGKISPEVQAAVSHELFVAYHCDGANMADDETIVAIAVKGGMPKETAAAAIHDAALRAATVAAAQQSRREGVTSVPTFRMPDGAQVSNMGQDGFEKLLKQYL